MEDKDIYNDPIIESDDWLSKSYDTDNVKEKIKYLKKSIKLNPDNLDSLRDLVTYTENDELKKLDKYIEIVNKGKKDLEKDDFFNKDSIGVFWGIIETRPYMRCKNLLMVQYIKCGLYSQALDEALEMIELCEHDNLGVRYNIIMLYVLLERFDELEKFLKRYDFGETLTEFPKAIYYYKIMDYKKLNKAIKEINEENPHILNVFTDKEKAMKVDYYSIGDITEASVILEINEVLLKTVPEFVEYYKKRLTK